MMTIRENTLVLVPSRSLNELADIATLAADRAACGGRDPLQDAIAGVIAEIRLTALPEP